MKFAEITALYKGKGSMNDLMNVMGIFIVSIYRAILMKLLYNEKKEIIKENMSYSQVGAIPNKNIRNHTWILNGILNENLKSKKNPPLDLGVYDVRQCFDGLWPEECLNDLYSYGVQDSALPLLYNGCQDIELKIRTPVGITKSAKIEKTVMQGDVWGSPACSVSIDSIGKECLEEHKYLYHYKGIVPIPPLAMVDDLLTISECGPTSVQLNSYINHKIRSKNLQWGSDKCKKMRIGKSHSEETCPESTIDGWKEILVKNVKTGKRDLKDIYEGDDLIKIEEHEKYLGDIVSRDGKNTKNITARVNRGRGIVRDLNATLVEMLASKEHFELGVTFRNAMLISSLLTNCEAWYNITNVDIVRLESVDEQMLRGISKAHRMTTRALLYLELGCIPIRYIIKSRRLNFLHYILNQKEDSTIKQFFNAQNKGSSKTDWTETVKKDLNELDIKINFEEIKCMSKTAFKKLVKKKIEVAALSYLNSQIKTKGKEIKPKQIEMAEYLTHESELNVKEKQDILKIRTQMLEVKVNFKNKHKEYKCDSCKKKGNRKNETQRHIYKCKELSDKKYDKRKPKFREIYGKNVRQMKEILIIIKENMKHRDKELNKG